MINQYLQFHLYLFYWRIWFVKATIDPVLIFVFFIFEELRLIINIKIKIFIFIGLLSNP